MGKVATVVKVFPVDGADANALLEKVRGVEGCTDARVEDFVFGSKIVRASLMCDDSQGTDFEEILSKLDGVKSVQVENVSLV
ncbi:MAG: hypothetical protein ACE5DI_00545 [Candidatus Micrarchaeia archaeon]